jgi:hypothetical protein
MQWRNVGRYQSGNQNRSFKAGQNRFEWRLLGIPLVSSNISSLYCLSCFEWWLLVIPLVWCLLTFRHCIFCPALLEDTKGINRSRHSKQDRQYNDEKLKHTKGVIRSRHSKQGRQCNDEMLEDAKGVTRSFDWRLLDIPLVSSNISSLHCLSCFERRLLVTPLASSNISSLHCLPCFEWRDTKGISRNRHSKQDRQYNDEMLEYTKGITRSRHSKQDRKYNDEMLEDTKPKGFVFSVPIRMTASGYPFGVF